MSARIFSAAVVGLDGHVVEVEAAHSRGLRNFLIVGLPDAAVKEARERVSAALKFSGFDMPRGRVAVNLAPADIKKQGTSYDLPIALSILAATEMISPDRCKKSLFVGELALDGTMRPVGCVLLIALAAKAAGMEEMIVPNENTAEATLVSGLPVYGASSLSEVVRHLRGEEALALATPVKRLAKAEEHSVYDMAFVRGQESVKRALEIAAAGRHNILMYGPPGTGKTLLARTLPTIMPALTDEEALQVTKLHSVAGVLPYGFGLVQERPFRNPHHTSSGVALVGGGTNPRPGEVSLAHQGVLFLDEFPEFHRHVLENLRQPLEDGVVTVSRAAGTVQYPAKFMLVAAMNPCPCGYAGDPLQRCTCTRAHMERYRKRISGPLLDRIDLMMEVPRVDFEKLTGEETGESSVSMRKRIEAVRERTATRGEINVKTIRRICELNEEGKRFLKEAVERLGLSARSFTRILKVARTIADLSGETLIRVEHLAEALQYRPKSQAAST